MIISVVIIIAVLFWDDIKTLLSKFKNTDKMSTVKFKSNTNNPFNIKANKANNWQGKNTKEGATFESFDSIEYGIRAGIKLLSTYFNKYKLNTIEKIIPRYAPPSENDTAGYIDFVSSETGFQSDQPIDWTKENIWKLSHALCKMENGYNLNREDYETAWQLL